jgi:hypothetical protein
MLSWRTPQCSLLEDLDVFSETWPRWGMMRDGECWERTIPELPTNEIGFGLWPTPTCHNSKEAGYPSEFTRNTPTLTSQAHGGKPIQLMSLNPIWVEWLMGWPIGWTDLKLLEMDKFQAWWRSHGGF